MSWGVDFWNNANSSYFRIGNHAFNVILGVYSAEATVFTEFGQSGDLHWKAVLVYDMPVQDI